ncbi:hypothetical protein [Salinicoccus cyprini]|nr:hypothetical protein [Salinicoccus cyprini]
MDILVFALIVGSAGTFISALVFPQTFDYEEFYLLDNELSAEQYSNISIQVNEMINNDETRLAETVHREGSNTIELKINDANKGTIEGVKTEFDEILSTMGLSFTDDNGTQWNPINNFLPKVVTIIISILIGTIIGVVYALGNRRVMSDEDVKHYLGQKTLGTF